MANARPTPAAPLGAAGPPNAVEIRSLTKRYKGFALCDVTFDVPRGAVTGLVGPNGAGKTTLVKLVMNLVRRDAGAIRVFGLDNLRDEPAIKARVGFVYDVPRFHEDIRLKDIASALAPFYAAWDARRFRTLLDEFELSPRTIFKKLSHGMKMKFALAVALCHDADLILMDEPTAGLDPAFRFDLLNRLRALIQDERKTVLFSSHITSDLERIADYITFINDGRLVFSAAKDDILDSWGVVRSPSDDLRPADIPALRGWRRTAYALEALTSDAAAARRALGGRAVCDKAGLEDIMFFISRGDSHD
jgi:ABC-2 type transport system ATP-binding protein